MGSPSINTIAQALSPSNVGIGAYQLDPKIIKGALIVPKGYALTGAQVATLQTKLVADTLNDAKNLRIYPIANFVETKDSSEAAPDQKFGYGPSLKVRDGYYTWSFQFVQGGKTLNDALRTFNGPSWDAFFIDANNVLMGTQNPNDAAGLKAIPITQIYTEPFKLNDGKKVAEYIIEFTFDPKYINEESTYISNASFDILNTILGLQTVNLTVGNASTPAAKTWTVNVATPLGVNLGPIYGTTPGSALSKISAWTVSDQTTGVSLTISTVTYNSSTQLFTIVTSNAPGSVGDTVAINLVGPTELAASSIGVVGFESAAAGTFVTTI